MAKPGWTSIGIAVTERPEQARAEIERAYEQAGTSKRAAKALGVSVQSLRRWRRRLGMPLDESKLPRRYRLAAVAPPAPALKTAESLGVSEDLFELDDG